MKILTEYVYPPIPVRNCDWAAMTENYDLGSPTGTGATEREAIDDLMNEHCRERDAETDKQGCCRICGSVSGPCQAVLP